MAASQMSRTNFPKDMVSECVSFNPSERRTLRLLFKMIAWALTITFPKIVVTSSQQIPNPVLAIPSQTGRLDCQCSSWFVQDMKTSHLTWWYMWNCASGQMWLWWPPALLTPWPRWLWGYVTLLWTWPQSSMFWDGWGWGWWTLFAWHWTQICPDMPQGDFQAGHLRITWPHPSFELGIRKSHCWWHLQWIPSCGSIPARPNTWGAMEVVQNFKPQMDWKSWLAKQPNVFLYHPGDWMNLEDLPSWQLQLGWWPSSGELGVSLRSYRSQLVLCGEMPPFVSFWPGLSSLPKSHKGPTMFGLSLNRSDSDGNL